MKIASIIALSIVFLLLIQAIMTYAANRKTERQKYTVAKQEEGFEIRHYPMAVMATVYSDAAKNQNRNNNFRRLASYIFGGNKSDQQIAMTAPVYMEQENGKNKMSFVLPSKYKINDLPQPNDSSINIHLSEDGYYAALRFGGYAGDEKIKAKELELQELLKTKGYIVIGTYKYLGYNAPWDIINRENDIIVKIVYP